VQQLLADVRLQSRPMRRACFIAAACCALAGALVLPLRAHAGPAENIYTPIVDYREWELELKGGIQDFDNRDRGELAYKFAFGYGIAPRWASEIEVEYPRSPGAAARVEEIEWENIFQLTEHGEHWMDVGIFNEFDHNRLEHRNTFVIGPMFQKETGRSQFNLNINWERRLSAAPAEGEDDEGDARRVVLRRAVEVESAPAIPAWRTGVRRTGRSRTPAFAGIARGPGVLRGGQSGRRQEVAIQRGAAGRPHPRDAEHHVAIPA